MKSTPNSFTPYLAYSASAGSGKTFALAVRYISLLFMGEEPQSILAATFTNKAAKEMRERVLDSLRLLSDDKNRPFLDAISKETGFSREEILSKQPIVLESFLTNSNFIVTLDSFFASILRSSSFEIGLEPEFAIKERGNDKLEEIFLTELDKRGLLHSLVELSISIGDRQFSNIFNLMEKLYKIDPLLPNRDREICNLQDIEIDINRIRLRLLDLVTSSGASKSAIKNFQEENIKLFFKKPLFKKESLLEHSHYKKYIILYPEIDVLYQELKIFLSKWAEYQESLILNNLFEVYSYYKNANISNAQSSNILSFDDLSYFTYRLLTNKDLKEFIYFKIDSKFKHILLDEFQDTSTLQYLMLEPLIDEIFSGVGQGDFRSFFYVGDTKQSLYRFRGGVEELFDKVASNYGVKIEQMDTNYRSSKYVVEQVNYWFNNNMKDYTPQKSREDALNGFVEVIEPINDDGETILLQAIDTAKEMIKNGISLDKITFLVFTNSDGEMLQNLCHSNKIETILKTSSSLQKIPKIASIVALMQYLFYNKSKYYSAYLSAFLENIEICEDFDFSWFNPYMRPFDVIDRLIREFGYFNKDPNILKLLNFSSKYSDIPSFTDEFSSASLSVASNTLHGALIMTIHSSKGLEFENVIIIDKLKRENSDKEPLLFDYNDKLFVDKIYYRISGRENFDEKYKNILEARKIASHKDSLNLLYVALTRAIEQMVVIKKKDKSRFDMIGMDIIKIGVPIVKETPPVIKKEIDIKPLVINYYGRQDTKQDKDKDKKTDEVEIEVKDYDAINFGLALHYLLELLRDFNIESISEALESSKNHYGLVIENELWKDIENRAFNLITNIEFQNILKDAKIYKEQSISYLGELKQIDLLLEYENSYTIIDYKSSKKFEDKHKQQVSHYCRAIQSIGKKETKGIIIYLLKDRIEIINIT